MPRGRYTRSVVADTSSTTSDHAYRSAFAAIANGHQIVWTKPVSWLGKSYRYGLIGDGTMAIKVSTLAGQPVAEDNVDLIDGPEGWTKEPALVLHETGMLTKIADMAKSTGQLSSGEAAERKTAGK